MTTSSISSGSIDVSAIVSALMEVESVPLQRMQQNISGIQNEISEIGKLNSAMDKLRSASRDLTDLSSWRASAGSSSDEEAVAITASSGALQGNFAVEVKQLASHQTIVSDALEDKTAVVGGGALTIQFGTDDGGFGADPDRPPLEITIPAGSSLQNISAAINAAGAGIGASLVTDSQGTRLMIRSSESGEDQAFQLSATSDGTSESNFNLNSLAYVPGQAAGTVTATQQAGNALFELNGLELESTSNNPEGVLENVALSLNKVTDGAVDVEVNSDSEAIRGQMDAFITAYNEVNTLIKSQTKYDAETQTAGPLQGNRTVLLAQSRLREILRTQIDVADSPDSDEAFTRLSDIGIEVERDGSLSLDDSKFELAAASPDKLEALFATGGTEDSQHGFGRLFDTAIGNLLDVDGAITGATETLRRREDAIEDQQDRFERRLEDIQTRLTRQYTNLDANLSTMTSALGALDQLG